MYVFNPTGNRTMLAEGSTIVVGRTWCFQEAKIWSTPIFPNWEVPAGMNQAKCGWWRQIQVTDIKFGENQPGGAPPPSGYEVVPDGNEMRVVICHMPSSDGKGQIIHPVTGRPRDFCRKWKEHFRQPCITKCIQVAIAATHLSLIHI